MNSNWKQTATFVVVLAGLAAIGTAMSPSPASAQGGKPVTQVSIVDSVPLPISGSVSIANSSPLPVTLSSSTPVPVQNVDEPGRNPYQETVFALDCGGKQACNFEYAVVPDGKRLVITNVTGFVDVVGGTIPNSNIQSNFGGNQYASVFFVMSRGTLSSTGSTRMAVNQSMQAYFGPGEKPHLFTGLFSTNDTFVQGGSFQLSGYYVNLP